MSRSIGITTAVLFSVMTRSVLAQTDPVPPPPLPRPDLKVDADPTKTVALPTPSATPVQAVEVDDPRCVDLEIRLIELRGPVKLPVEPSKPGNAGNKTGSDPKVSQMPPIRMLTKDETADFVKSCQADPRSNILMAPRMRLPLGRKGQLRSGGEVAYGVEPAITNAETGEVTPEKTLTEFFGTAVDATVTVPKPNLLRVNLTVEHSTVMSQKVQPGQRPAKDARRVQTTVDCPNGQTAMFRGLKSQRQTASITRLPILGDIPVLGDTFSKKRVDHEEVELVLLITPVLLDQPPK
ncbi:MAG: hypothetical protein Q8K78_15455 [Planctomycetaceae bacterium]|nr:hypothetical protein [Planctomycetaceae bacterium]